MFCKKCGKQISDDSINCPNCGTSTENVAQQAAAGQPIINIVNTNTNTNANTNAGGIGNPKNKWVAFVLCLFLGYLGAHKFYDGKAGMGILYLCTLGLFGIGWIIDIISILGRPNPYYVSY